MTEKRFHREDNCCGYYTEINLGIKELVELLKHLREENIQLKEKNKKLEKHLQRYYSDEEVDLLNELNDKCEFLEIENESLEDGATKYAELYHKSLKENRQLRELLEEGLEVSQVEIDEELERMNSRS